MKRKLNIVLLSFFCLTAVAQTKNISMSITYYGDPNVSPKEAMAAAIEQARIAALGKEFGTLITQDILSQEDNENSYFMQMSNAEVKGEWIEDTEKPEAKIVDTTPEGVLIIEAKVKGRAQALKNEAADFEALALRNGTDKNLFASTDFKSDDKLYLYFKAPADGFVAAYLIDEQQRVLCLLPHESSSTGLQPVTHDKEYVFFSVKHDAEYANSNSYEDGLVVMCDDERIEMNRIYVIFSPNPFVKPVDQSAVSLGHDNLILPRQISLNAFSRWMHKVYARDKKMSRKVLRLKIRP